MRRDEFRLATHISIDSKSSGGLTDRLERMVESMEIRAHLAACARLLERVITRSMIGLPYFDSPI